MLEGEGTMMKAACFAVLAASLIASAAWAQTTRPSRTTTKPPSAKEMAQAEPLAEAQALGIKTVDLESPSLQYAIEPATGQVAAIHPQNPELKVWPKLTGPEDVAG